MNKKNIYYAIIFLLVGACFVKIFFFETNFENSYGEIKVENGILDILENLKVNETVPSAGISFVPGQRIHYFICNQKGGCIIGREECDALEGEHCTKLWYAKEENSTLIILKDFYEYEEIVLEEPNNSSNEIN